MKKALVLQLSRLGDILQSTLLLNSLKKENYKIFLLGDEKNSSIANEIPLIDQFIPFEIGGFLKKIKDKNLSELFNELLNFVESLNRENFDILINLNHSLINLYLSQLINAEIKKGFKIENNSFIDFIYSNIRNGRESNFFNLVDLFNCFSNIKAKSKNLFINKSISNKNLNFLKKILKKENNITLHLGAGHELRRWSVEKFAKLAHLILQYFKNTTITLTGSKNEAKFGREFIKFLPPEYKSDIINLIGKTDIPLLKAVLLKSSILISVDTGIMHLASACGINLISMFYASAFVHETGPYTEKALILSPNETCYPCTEFYQPCNDFHCKDNICEQDLFECVKFFFNNSDNDTLKNYFTEHKKRVNLYKPAFDKFGIYYENIIGPDSSIKKIREKGFKLCLKRT